MVFKFDTPTLDIIWEKAFPVEGLPPSLVRKDVCGALIVRNRFDDNLSDFGWVVDHIYPSFNGGGDDIDNLRPMQWQNNKAKGNDYPVYFGAVRSNDQNTGNEPFTGQYRVSEELQKRLSKLYE